MKENIYTIPVLEAFENAGECPFCAMHEKLTRDALDFMLGSAYMEDDIRMDTNKIGFCPNHSRALFYEQNRLGLSLIMHTHLQQINKDLEKLVKDIPKGDGSKKSLFKKTPAGIEGLTSYIDNLDNSCYICNRIDNTFLRYVDTFFYLWKKDSELKEIVEKSNGFCLNHYGLLLKQGEEKLSSKEFPEFMALATELQLKNLARVEEDLDWFVKKYDYRFAKEPWKNSKDALLRVLKKVSSITVEDN